MRCSGAASWTSVRIACERVDDGFAFSIAVVSS
jgi:hypothetical protein